VLGGKREEVGHRPGEQISAVLSRMVECGQDGSKRLKLLEKRRRNTLDNRRMHPGPGRRKLSKKKKGRKKNKKAGSGLNTAQDGKPGGAEWIQYDMPAPSAGQKNHKHRDGLRNGKQLASNQGRKQRDGTKTCQRDL